MSKKFYLCKGKKAWRYNCTSLSEGEALSEDAVGYINLSSCPRSWKGKTTCRTWINLQHRCFNRNISFSVELGQIIWILLNTFFPLRKCCESGLRVFLWTRDFLFVFWFWVLFTRVDCYINFQLATIPVGLVGLGWNRYAPTLGFSDTGVVRLSPSVCGVSTKRSTQQRCALLG